MTKKHPFLSAASAKAARDAALATAPALLTDLACIAAFHVEDPQAQMKVYAAMKTINVLADLPPMPPKK
jgi:hypothetical protein